MLFTTNSLFLLSCNKTMFLTVSNQHAETETKRVLCCICLRNQLIFSSCTTPTKNTHNNKIAYTGEKPTKAELIR